MGYRETYFKYNKPFFGKYRCVRCGKWFRKDQIDIDHRIPKRNGGMASRGVKDALGIKYKRR